MEITVELPNNLDQQPDPARTALEALAIAGYRSGKLTSFQVGRILGFTSRFEVDKFFKERNITEHAYSRQDLDADQTSLEKLNTRV